MANQEHLDILKQGVEVWNEWRKEHPDIHVDLTGADFSLANLSGANLSNADFKGATLWDTNLSRSNLERAELQWANLSGADLSKAHLHEARLMGAGLYHAKFIEANLQRAKINDARLPYAILHRAKLNGAYLWGSDLRETDFSGADLSGANLMNTQLVLTNFTGATLSGCKVYGASAWDLKLEGAIQENLVVTGPNEPHIITVDDLEVAQFIYLLLNHKKLRDVLNAVTERGVLILGRFGGGGLEVLQAIAAKLREENYLPIIFDFERPQDRNYTETVKTLVGLSRFVIVDLSGPSVPQELYATIPHFKIPFIPIIEEGRKTYALFADLLEYPWVLKPVVEFASENHLMELLPSRMVAPAEEKFKERQALLQQLFNR